MTVFLETYAIGSLLAVSLFIFHSITSALKTSCSKTEARYWQYVTELLVGSVAAYVLGALWRTLWSLT